MSYYFSPVTGRKVKKGSKTDKDLIAKGLVTSSTICTTISESNNTTPVSNTPVYPITIPFPNEGICSNIELPFFLSKTENPQPEAAVQSLGFMAALPVAVPVSGLNSLLPVTSSNPLLPPSTTPTTLKAFSSLSLNFPGQAPSTNPNSGSLLSQSSLGSLLPSSSVNIFPLKSSPASLSLVSTSGTGKVGSLLPASGTGSLLPASSGSLLPASSGSLLPASGTGSLLPASSGKVGSLLPASGTGKVGSLLPASSGKVGSLLPASSLSLLPSSNPGLSLLPHSSPGQGLLPVSNPKTLHTGLSAIAPAAAIRSGTDVLGMYKMARADAALKR